MAASKKIVRFYHVGIKLGTLFSKRPYDLKGSFAPRPDFFSQIWPIGRIVFFHVDGFVCKDNGKAPIASNQADLFILRR